MEAASYFEVLSDVATTIGGVVLVFPTKRFLDRKAIIHETRVKTLARARPGVKTDDLKALVDRLDVAISQYEPRDRTEVLVGLWFVIGGFALKLVYHALHHNWLSLIAP